jgi:hypothetical protein
LPRGEQLAHPLWPVSTKATLLKDKVEGILFDRVESIMEVELECDGLHTSFTETLK